MRKIVTRLILPLMLAAAVSSAGNQETKEYVMFGGADVDSNEQASAWIPVKNASRVVIRTWSTHLVFGASNADSGFSDSIATWKTLLSDSICCFVTGPMGNTIASAADSVQITGWGADSTKQVGVLAVAANKQLRAPATGSGVYTVVYPSQIAGSATPSQGDDAIQANFMRVRVTPLRRLTANTSTCSGGCGVRVNGLRGLRMRAMVYYANR